MSRAPHPLPYLLRPCIVGMGGSMVIRLQPCMIMSAPPLASLMLQAMSAWSVKTRRVPSRHCRDARVYGHTTTDMHDMSTPSRKK